jgi:hypothetical protein
VAHVDTLPVHFIDAALDRTPVSLGPRRTASPHEFYRYPARFSPRFAAAAIEAFSAPGDLVMDPFVGGGTTLVEGVRLGRRTIGADLNPLATFVTRAKTTRLVTFETEQIAHWINGLNDTLRLTREAPLFTTWESEGYFKDLNAPDTWRVKKLVALALSSIPTTSSAIERFCRCIVLRSSQWALDMRGSVPSVSEFRRAMIENGQAMLEAMESFSREILDNPVPRVLDAGLPGLADRLHLDVGITPQLVLTSPPYPGVYVNYHRWKLRGRREIPAPFWIADRRDGHGLAHYTMSARAEPTLAAYFRQLSDAFRDLARLLCPDSIIIQMVGFNQPDTQLPRYLEALNLAGYKELSFSSGDLSSSDDGRLWRSVPGRRWWTAASTRRDAAPHTSREVVLFHAPRAT